MEYASAEYNYGDKGLCTLGDSLGDESPKEILVKREVNSSTLGTLIVYKLMPAKKKIKVDGSDQGEHDEVNGSGRIVGTDGEICRRDVDDAVGECVNVPWSLGKIEKIEAEAKKKAGRRNDIRGMDRRTRNREYRAKKRDI